VKNFSNKLERYYSFKAIHEQIMKNRICIKEKSGIDFHKNKVRGKRWGKRRYEKEMKKLEEEKLSRFMCFSCHEWVTMP
jgi:hypothetical protein